MRKCRGFLRASRFRPQRAFPSRTGASRSFHVVLTGHTAQTGDTLPESLEALAALHGTLVFLMGLNSLEQIAARLTAAGKPPETPAAVVSGGNAPHPATVRGTLADIAEKARAARVQAPAVIVVGAAAALELCAPAAPVLPLAGVRVGLVGTPAFTERLARRLEALGAAAVPCMTARVRPLPPQPGWERLADGRSCWVVLTSRNGVGCFFDALAAARIDVRRLHACRFAAIGPATAEALAQRGITADLCPEQATGAELARALCAAAGPGEEILLFRAAESSPEMRGILTAQGFSVREYTLYKTEYAAASPNAEADYLAFASAGGVRARFSVRRGAEGRCVRVHRPGDGPRAGAADRCAVPDGGGHLRRGRGRMHSARTPAQESAGGVKRPAAQAAGQEA